MPSSRRAARTLTTASTLLRLEEAESALNRWYYLCMIHATAEPYCPIALSKLVIYHLIGLNAITCFPEVERLARKEAFSDCPSKWNSQHYHCIQEPKKLSSTTDKFYDSFL